MVLKLHHHLESIRYHNLDLPTVFQNYAAVSIRDLPCLLNDISDSSNELLPKHPE